MESVVVYMVQMNVDGWHPLVAYDSRDRAERAADDLRKLFVPSVQFRVVQQQAAVEATP